MTQDALTLPILLTIDEIAKQLSISRDAAYQRVSRGQMPGVVRFGRRIRVHRDVLLRAIERGAGK